MTLASNFECKSQVHWLSEHAAANLLLDEVEAESDRVWNFIIAREIETPDRFRAIQSYRCVHCHNVRHLVAHLAGYWYMLGLALARMHRRQCKVRNIPVIGS